LDFFLENFNWTVFENELKWYWTEKERGKVAYTEADELCNLCIDHGILMRGHCIFWEAEDAVQQWVKELDHNELDMAVQNRLIDVVSRFRGRFEHYDVNNEMLHGSFYKDRLGEQILPYMFKLAKQFDPGAKLFVNDYHVVDGMDAKSSPEKYINQIRSLQEKGAAIDGIGVQGHITCPVGPIVGNALDRLAMLGIPIWFTEVDVESPNEFLRSEDLEVVLREAFAHPAVEGILLWGFMEMAMYRQNAHLVDSDGLPNEAGKKLIALRKEWQTSCSGITDDAGCFSFRGYHGVYTLHIEDSDGRTTQQQEFELKSGDDVFVLEVDDFSPLRAAKAL
jgi:GH35 family endo-1,4-beta-xylanase